ncbi:MAG: hypothetical protein SVU32_06640, partial [Candidatus Nanohaloarchaea archaeon]|nr:hypothetical protein [Candidatus Nanohaloarchaea archaeon]
MGNGIDPRYSFDSTDSLPVKTYVRTFHDEIAEAFGVESTTPIRIEYGMPEADTLLGIVRITDCRYGAVYNTLPALAEEIGHVVAERSSERSFGHGDPYGGILAELLGNLGRGVLFEDNLEALVDRYDTIATDIGSIAGEEQAAYTEDRLDVYKQYLEDVRDMAEQAPEDTEALSSFIRSSEDELYGDVCAEVGSSVVANTMTGKRSLDTGAVRFFEDVVALGSLQGHVDWESLEDAGDEDGPQGLSGDEVDPVQVRSTAAAKLDRLQEYDRGEIEEYMERQCYGTTRKLT